MKVRYAYAAGVAVIAIVAGSFVWGVQNVGANGYSCPQNNPPTCPTTTTTTKLPPTTTTTTVDEPTTTVTVELIPPISIERDTPPVDVVVPKYTG